MSTKVKALGKQLYHAQALKILTKQKAVIAFIGLMLIMLIFASDTNFYSTANWMNVFRASSPNLIVAFGITFAVVCRGCDLSVGSVMAMTGILAVQMVNNGMNLGLAIVLAVLSGSAVGFINGFLIVQQKTEAFIITLGMGMLVKGIALQLTNGNPVPARDPGSQFMNVANGNIFGIPYLIIYMLVLGVIAFLLLRYTSFGRNCYALGGDYEVAEHSGINVIRTKWIAFVISGTYAGIAGVLLASRMNTGSAIYGDEIPLITNASVVIGGTSFAGGVGGPIHSFLGVLLIQFLRNCMLMFRIVPFTQTLILGIVVVGIIASDCLTAKWRTEGISPMDVIRDFFRKRFAGSKLQDKKT